MRLLLVRHGETVDNVAGNFAGVTDSALTAHGVLQAERLGAHLAARFSAIRAVFTSDLQRASRTGRAIRAAQQQQQQATQNGDADNRGIGLLPPLTETPLLRERDFGPLEGVSFRTCDVNPDDVAESSASMRRRAERFVTEMLLPTMLASSSHKEYEEAVVVIVAHGLLLPKLYAALCARVHADRLTFDAAVLARKRPGAAPLQPWWSNTAYLELLVTMTAAAAASNTVTGQATSRNAATTTLASLHVVCVNCTVHLADLKRTRGGIGSAPHDDTQRKIQSYFGGKKL